VQAVVRLQNAKNLSALMQHVFSTRRWGTRGKCTVQPAKARLFLRLASRSFRSALGDIAVIMAVARVSLFRWSKEYGVHPTIARDRLGSPNRRTAVNMCIARCVGTLGFAVLLATAASAAVNISNKPTQNMSCSAGVCTATAQKAYLNVNDVTSMLAAGDLKIATGDVGAQDIHIEAPFSWTSTSRLTLDAQRSIEFKKPVTVAGTGALRLITNDGGTGGDYWFGPGAKVTFWDRNSSLVVNGLAFTLVPGIKTLAADIAHHPLRHYALARDYDATADGTYGSSPISTQFQGIFEGLGNTISNVAFTVRSGFIEAGFFAQLDTAATVRDVRITGLNLICRPKYAACGVTGGLAAYNYGTVNRTVVEGTIQAFTSCMGGLIGINAGTIARSAAKVEIENGGHKYDSGCPSPEYHMGIGGLVGYNTGNILQSSSNGYSAYHRTGQIVIGGLAGTNTGAIENSYATTNVQEGGTYYSEPHAGGLVGWNSNAHSILFDRRSFCRRRLLHLPRCVPRRPG
jgi:hypothetical protein